MLWPLTSTSMLGSTNAASGLQRNLITVERGSKV